METMEDTKREEVKKEEDAQREMTKTEETPKKEIRWLEEKGDEKPDTNLSDHTAKDPIAAAEQLIAELDSGTTEYRNPTGDRNGKPEEYRNPEEKPKEGETEAAEKPKQRADACKDDNGFTYYKCRFCGLTFNYMTTLKAHERVHDVNQPYTCNKCGEAFHYMCELEYHAKTHLKQKGYKCECGRTFFQAVIEGQKYGLQGNIPNCDSEFDNSENAIV